MSKHGVAATLPVLVALLIAGCGSSSKSSSAAPAKPATSPSAPAAAASPYGPAASTANPTASAAALIATKHDKLGTILAYGPKKLTVYLFQADKGSTSSCTGECARVWPPVTGKPEAGSGAVSSELGSTSRPGGGTQVTYKGHPLYLYAKDKDDGDTYGQGIKSFGAEWYALRPSGDKADRS